MKVLELDGKKVIATDDKRVQVDFKDSLYDVIEQAKALERDKLDLVLIGEGLEVNPKIEDKTAFLLAMSFIQNKWYEIVVKDEGLLSEVRYAHESRVAKYLTKLSSLDGKKRKITSPEVPHVDVSSTAEENKTPSTTEEIVIETPAEKGVTDAPKITYHTSPNIALHNRRYRLGSPKPDEAVKLKGFRKIIFETVAAEPERVFEFEEIIEAAKAKGATFGGKDGGKNQTQYQLKELNKLELVLTVPAQGEIT